MATDLPSVTHTGCSGDMSTHDTGQNNNSKVLISIDDTNLLYCPAEPIRARSLNRLDSLDEKDASCVDIYRCPSFPRLQRRYNSQMDNMTNCSMTHLETNSMSPRVSTDNLTNITREDYDSRERLSLGGYPGLMRSVSSRTVDELPPLEFPVSQFERMTHKYLSPNLTFSDKIPQPVSRSTSCPSMAYARRSPSPHSLKSLESPRTGHKPELTVVIDGHGAHERTDINQEGKVINETPISSGTPRPDTGGQGIGNSDKSHGAKTIYEEHPMHTKRLLEKQRERLSLIKQNGELLRSQHKASGSRETSHSSQKLDKFVNIGDISSTVAEKVMDNKVRGNRGVQKKCLQWLNSLDNDDSS